MARGSPLQLRGQPFCVGGPLAAAAARLPAAINVEGAVEEREHDRGVARHRSEGRLRSGHAGAASAPPPSGPKLRKRDAVAVRERAACLLRWVDLEQVGPEQPDALARERERELEFYGDHARPRTASTSVRNRLTALTTRRASRVKQRAVVAATGAVPPPAAAEIHVQPAEVCYIDI